MDPDEVKSNLAWRISTDEMIAVELKSSHKMMEMYIWESGSLTPSKWDTYLIRIIGGKGYAKESCKALIGQAFSGGIHRIFAECDPSKSRLLETAGVIWDLNGRLT